MIEYLKEIGIPLLLVGLIAIFILISIELWNIVKEQRLKNAEAIFKSILTELEDSLQYFYLPLKERLLVTQNIFLFSQNFIEQGSYLNSKLKIESADPKALRNIFVQRIFLPLNTEIEYLIKNQIHHKSADDNIKYEKILEHYILWRTLEEAKKDKDIEKYNAEDILKFPSEELDKIITICNNLLEEQKEIRKKVLRLQNVYNNILKQIGG